MSRETRFTRELALGKLQSLQRLQEHFAEPSPALEEDELGLAHACAIFRFLPHELQRANHISRLAQPVFGGSYLTDIHIRQIRAKHGVDEVCDKSLTVVVVHDDRLESLEESKVVPQERAQLVCEPPPQREPIGAFLLPDGKRLVVDRAKPHEREHLEEDLAALFEIDVPPFVLFANYGTGVDCFFRIHIQEIELVAKLLFLLFDTLCLVMKYHRDQIEFGVRPHVARFVDEYPKVRHGIAPRYRNGGEYPRRRVDQDLFDQSVIEQYKTCELLRQQAIPPDTKS